MGHCLLAVGSGSCFLTFGIVPCRSNSAHCSKMPAKKDIASTSAASKCRKGGRAGASSESPSSEKPTKFLNEQEFREHFCISDGVFVHLVDGDPTSTEKTAQGAIFFSKEQFNVGLYFSLPSLFKQFLHCTQIPPTHIHPNIVRLLMGCSILNMFFHLDLSLLEVLFVYTIRKGKNDIFNMFAHIPSLQLVTGLPDSNKGRVKGHVLVRGLWAGLIEHPKMDFRPNFSLKIHGRDGLERSFLCFFLLN